MNSKEFKKVGRLLKELYKELEAEALANGVDIFGDAYKILQARVRLALLVKMGFTLEEYQAAKQSVLDEQKKETREAIAEVKDRLNETDERVATSPSLDDMEAVAKKYIKEPVVTHNTEIVKEIIKETTIEKPTIVKETVIKREEFDDNYLMAELGYLNERIDSLVIPEGVDEEKLRTDLRNMFAELFEHNINLLGMPDFRKLAMGLQAQIDENRASVAAVAHVWGAITGTLSNQTDLQTALDGKVDTDQAVLWALAY